MSAPVPRRWERLSPYLDQALTLTDQEREEWLAELRGKDPGLAEELRGLLNEHRAMLQEGFLEQQPLMTATALEGQSVGAYTLIAPIGEGGMGSIWLAERNDGRFQRRAAVKFLHRMLLGRGGEERFRREGSILGRVSHPHIAELLDAGVAGDGQPYLILEHVEGKHIDEYCDAKRLGLEARVAVFLDVLDAVAHAHANLVVHRDLKPSNVLVRTDGQVKLLDFGIAKLLESEADTGATVTQQGGALTPAYAAPEQITGGPVTTATDVYALGVLLYVLLTGQHPAGCGNLSTADLVKAIVEAEPPRMSDAVVSDRLGAETREANAANRGTTAEKLRRGLRGDLDTIVAKALKKNPQERYRAVTALADDLRRFLKQESISARPDTLAYRAAKFAARNRAALIVIGTTIVVVIASLSSGLYIANRQRAIAERRFVQVRELANKFIRMDEALRGIPGATKVRSRLVADSLQYLTSLGQEVQGDKELSLEIAYAYVRVAHTQGDPTSPNLGQFAEAEVTLQNASRFVEPILASEPRNERALFIACTIAHDQTQLDLVLDHRGERILADAGKTAALLERYTRLPKFDVYGSVYFYSNTAYTYLGQRHMDEAIGYWQRALALSQPDAKAHRLHGGILSGMATARWESGELDAALKSMQEAVQMQEKEAATGQVPLRVNLAKTYGAEAGILGRADAEPTLGRPREALALYEKGYNILEELANRDSGDSLSRENQADMGVELGNVLRRQDPRRALSVYDHSLARLHEVKTSPAVQASQAELLANSAYALHFLGQHEEARRRAERALEIMREQHKYPAQRVEPMSDVYDMMRAAADSYVQTGEIGKAVGMYRELLEGLMAWPLHLDSDLRDATSVSRTWSALAELLRVQGQATEAAGFEQQRARLWQQWQAKLPNGESLLRQSLIQAYRLPGSTARRRGPP